MTWFPAAYPIEIVTVLVSIAATAILFWWLFDAARDAIGLPAEDRLGPRGTLAIGNVHRACFRLMKSLILTGAGLTSLFLPPPPPIAAVLESEGWRLSLTISRCAIITVTVIILIDAFVERFFRRRYVRKLRSTLEDAAPPRANDQRQQVRPR